VANRILIKNSTSGANVPATNEVVVSELGANTTDGKLYLGTDLAGAGHSDPGDDSTELSWIGAPIKDEDDMASDSDDSLVTQQSIKAYVDNNFTQLFSHNCYWSVSTGNYIPWGGSQRIYTSATSSSYNDDIIFIAPFDGKLIGLWLRNNYSSTATPGVTTCYLNVNDTDGSVLNSGFFSWPYQTRLQYPCNQNNTFSAGDRLAVKVDPAATPRYVAITSVWEFTK